MAGIARDDFGRFAVGSEAAASARRVHRALERALAQDDWRRLHLGMDKLATAFADGAPWALDMVMSRLAGKPTQRIESGSGEPVDMSMQDLMRVILAARSVSASDVQVIDSPTLPALPSDPDPPMPLG